MTGRLRIIVKDDRDSSVGRGGYLLAEHFEPRMAKLTAAVARSTEELYPTAEVLRITEGWRPARHGRDLHTQLRAIDYTVEFPGGVRATVTEYRAIAESTRAKVGDAEYDFAVHGEGSNLHIHGEFDPR